MRVVAIILTGWHSLHAHTRTHSALCPLTSVTPSTAPLCRTARGRGGTSKWPEGGASFSCHLSSSKGLCCLPYYFNQFQLLQEALMGERSRACWKHLPLSRAQVAYRAMGWDSRPLYQEAVITVLLPSRPSNWPVFTEHCWLHMVKPLNNMNA